MNHNRRTGDQPVTGQIILVIDDDPDVGEFICSVAAKLGLPCTTTVDVSSFLRELRPDTTLIVLDLVMPETDGIEVLRLLAQQQCKAGIVLASGIGQRVVETAEALATSLGLSIAGRLLKPFRYAELEAALQKAAPSSPPGRTGAPRLAFSDDELRQAIRLREMVLFYQPQVDIRQNTVCGIEALVRWQHPTLGLLAPDLFLRRLEQLGLMGELGWLVVDRGLGEFQKLEAKASMLLSINMSVSSLHDLSFPDVLGTLLAKHRVSPKCLVVEITESRILDELSQSLDVLSRLRMKEVQLSIDDFGVGYSMLKQLRQIPATELKIDRSFVQRSETSAEDRFLVGKMIEIGHELQLRVVAEGVETKRQLQFLGDLRCDIAQGYFISKPMPFDQLPAWLSSWQIDTGTQRPELVDRMHS